MLVAVFFVFIYLFLSAENWFGFLIKEIFFHYINPNRNSEHSKLNRFQWNVQTWQSAVLKYWSRSKKSQKSSALHSQSVSPSLIKFIFKFLTLIGDWKTVIIRFSFVPLPLQVALKIKKMNFIFDIRLALMLKWKARTKNLKINLSTFLRFYFGIYLKEIKWIEAPLKFPDQGSFTF